MPLYVNLYVDIEIQHTPFMHIKGNSNTAPPLFGIHSVSLAQIQTDVLLMCCHCVACINSTGATSYRPGERLEL